MYTIEKQCRRHSTNARSLVACNYNGGDLLMPPKKGAKKTKKGAKGKKKVKKLKKEEQGEGIGPLCDTVCDQIDSIKKKLQDGVDDKEAGMKLAGVMHELNQLQGALKKLDIKPIERGSLSPSAEDPEFLGPDFQVTKWVPPSDAKATKSQNVNKFKGGKADYFATTSGELGQMGVGVDLYFKFLMYLSTLMLTLTVVNIPALVLNSEVSGMLFD